MATGEESYLVDLRESLRRVLPDLSRDQEAAIAARLQRHDGWLCAVAGMYAQEHAIIALSDSAIVAACLAELGGTCEHRNWIVGFDDTIPRRAEDIAKRDPKKLGVVRLDADAFNRIFPIKTQPDDTERSLIPNLKKITVSLKGRREMGIKWRPATIGGKTYDLSHLHPFMLAVTVPAKDGKPCQEYRLNVEFSLHCFTRDSRDGECRDAELLYSDNRETRIFDKERYRLSKMLPEIIRGIHNRRCYHTGYENFFIVEFIGEGGCRVEYSVYFKLSRSTKRGGLTFYVQSAYIQDAVPRGRPRPRKPIRFSVIAFNVTRGRPIRMPK